MTIRELSYSLASDISVLKQEPLPTLCSNMTKEMKMKPIRVFIFSVLTFMINVWVVGPWTNPVQSVVRPFLSWDTSGSLNRNLGRRSFS